MMHTCRETVVDGELTKLREECSRLKEMLILYEKRDREHQNKKREKKEEQREIENEKAELGAVRIDPEERRRARQAYQQLAVPVDNSGRAVKATHLQALALRLGLVLTNEETRRIARALGTSSTSSRGTERYIVWPRFLRWWAAVQEKVITFLYWSLSSVLTTWMAGQQTKGQT